MGKWLQYDFPKADFPKILGGIIIMLVKIFEKTSIQEIGFRDKDLYIRCKSKNKYFKIKYPIPGNNKVKCIALIFVIIASTIIK
jgi:hypothetical protein